MDACHPGLAVLRVAARRARVPGSGHLLTGAGARGRGRRRSARPRLCHGAQVAGDTVGLMEALAVDGQKSQIAQSPKANTLYGN